MKKSLLTLLLAAALAAPVFASEKGDMDLDLKLGYTVSDSIKIEYTAGSDSGSTDKNFILGADFYYYLHSNVALGVGINNLFYSKADYGYDDKYGFTNIYFSVKPKMDLKSDIFTGVYGIAQIGYGILRLDYDTDGMGPQPDKKNGLYWAVGAGAEIMKNFIFELIYSCNNAGIEFTNDPSADIKYSAFSVNVGYKFSL